MKHIATLIIGMSLASVALSRADAPEGTFPFKEIYDRLLPHLTRDLENRVKSADLDFMLNDSNVEATGKWGNPYGSTPSRERTGLS